MSEIASKLLIFRRSVTSGGAELAASRLEKQFESLFDSASLVQSGSVVDGLKVPGDLGPGWWRVVRYASAVNRILDHTTDEPVSFSMERGVRADIYRAGEGVHLAWIKRKGQLRSWLSRRLLHSVLITMERRTVQNAQFVVANSDMVADELRSFYRDYIDKIRVIRNGYDPERFLVQDEEDRSGLRKDGVRRLCFAGNGWERKGLSQAVELLSSLPENWRLWILGRGNRKKMIALAERLGCDDRIDFCGVVADIERFFHASDVFVLPTKYDPFSNACLEAMACGCPVVTTADNGFADLVEQRKTGFLLDSNKLDDCADWCENDLPQNRKEIAASIAKYTIDYETEQYREIFQNVYETKAKGNTSEGGV